MAPSDIYVEPPGTFICLKPFNGVCRASISALFAKS